MTAHLPRLPSTSPGDFEVIAKLIAGDSAFELFAWNHAIHLSDARSCGNRRCEQFPPYVTGTRFYWLILARRSSPVQGFQLLGSSGKAAESA
jgi:hypothetical protein